MEKKNFYTYQQLIHGLRDEYQKNQKLIEELKKLIEIESRYQTTSSLVLKQQPSSYHLDDYPTLLLRVSKRQREIKKKLIKLHDGFLGESPTIRRNNNSDFILKKDRGEYQFFSHNDLEGALYFHPNIFIRNQKEFSDLYRELQQTKLYNAKNSTILLNNFQDISLNGEGISLNTTERLKVYDPNVRITYSAEDDQVHLSQDTIHKYIFIDNLLDTEIPSYSIPDEYLRILEANPTKLIYIDSFRIQDYEKEDIIPLFEKSKEFKKS